MKQHITESDLHELSDEQRERLRHIWIPKERDLAVAFICNNAETGEIDQIVFNIGKIEYDEIETRGNRFMTKKFVMTFRSLMLVDDDFYEKLEKVDDNTEDIELDYQAPEDYFSYEYCLPLLNIGQMIEILSKEYFSTDSFFMKYCQNENVYQIGKKVDSYREEYIHHESKELCDALWEAVKSIL